jgi:hypothetical protein
MRPIFEKYWKPLEWVALTFIVEALCLAAIALPFMIGALGKF